MTIQYLLLNSGVSVPHSTRFVATCRDELVALRIELDLRYLILVTLEERRASSREYIIYPRQTVS